MTKLGVTGHYYARNIAAIYEWSLAWEKRNPDRFAAFPDEEGRLDYEGIDQAARDVLDIQTWCRAWIENDPDEGGDPLVRRDIRDDCPEIYNMFRQLV